MKAASSHNPKLQIYSLLLGFLVVGSLLPKSGAHQCNHGHDHHDLDIGVEDLVMDRALLLPEEIAEMEDLMEWEHGDHHHHDRRHNEHGHRVEELSGIGLWISAMGCSLLVSLASLVCLILLPVIFIKGTPSKTFVDCLAIFGAGAMLGDAFLHQLPHAFGGGHSHSHDQHDDHDHVHVHSEQSHSHSLQDLSVGLSILSGIVVFLIVEKIVRYVEEFSGGVNASAHGHHHHHHHKHDKKLKDDGDANAKKSEEKGSNEDTSRDDKLSGKDDLRKRVTADTKPKDEHKSNHQEVSNGDIDSIHKDEQVKPSKSSLVFGYLNLFSDGVHNFTDGMALGSAFLLYGSVGGWSRTLFLLAHELPQEIGDFGILVRSGFSVSKALFFNFLSALVALAGTALALMWGKDPGQSSLIEGFTAGGFIYIALAGVLAEMNTGVSSLRSSSLQLISLILGMAVALGISLVE